MSDKNTTNNGTHLTLENRQEIQACLDKGMTFKAIGRRIEKDPTTVSKEVKKHLQQKPLAPNRSQPSGVCPKLLKPPFVCNPCKQRPYACAFLKQFYYAIPAQGEYKALLHDAREGIPLGKEEFYKNQRVISDGIKRGQHLYHILQTEDLGVSKSTVYRHLKLGYLDVQAIDFPRVVKFKPRKVKHTPQIPKGLKIGRAFLDFQAYAAQMGLSAWVEMDTVIGHEGGKIILTLLFTSCNFMFGLLLENKTAPEAASKIRALKAGLLAAGVAFGDIFPVLLTDNGGEFADVFAFENNAEGKRETRLFFCDPMQSCQKPKVEKNHSLFRDIVPKGKSFDSFTQDTVNLIFSHVNSIKRHSLQGKTPFELFAFLYGPSLAALLGISPIPANQVVQSPALLAAQKVHAD